MSEKDRLKMKYLIDTTIDLINIEREMDTAFAQEPNNTTAQVYFQNKLLTVITGHFAIYLQNMPTKTSENEAPPS